MDAASLVEQLVQHRTLGQAPRAELEWLAAHGTVRHFDVGEPISRANDPVESLYVVLAGEFSIHVDRGAGPKKVMEWHGGDVGGLLPYSRLKTAPGGGFVAEPTDVLLVHRDHFPELIRTCPVVTTALVHVMLDRARIFTTSDLHDEKMLALGRLSAGLAHELNNPASAAARSAALLTEALAEAQAASRALGTLRLPEATLGDLDRLRERCLMGAVEAQSPLQHADREEGLSAWLDSHGIAFADTAVLADARVSAEDLRALAESLDAPALQTALRSIAADRAVRSLAGEIETATTRIHDLVAAVKRFTYMDRQAPELMDVAQGLRDTVTILTHKARTKAAQITLDIAADLPRVRAFGGELNQVWSNLIDNALDAVPMSGRIVVSATLRLGTVVVSVIDNGHGIPPEIREQIFEPFFTTKPVGAGTGLGLDIAQRLVRRNNGDIELESQPGRTQFTVTLPAVQP